MHQLAQSVIIFDEAQTLPIRCVHLFNNAINFLAEHCGSSVVLCTATQPLLNGVNEQKGRARFGEDEEIIPDPARLFEELSRTKIISEVRPGGWTDAEIAELAMREICESKSCLVIVNTRLSARSLYQQSNIDNDCKKYHLSTSMCPAHRRAVLARVRERLDGGKPVLCVSTQLIEAGVHIDFGSVIRYAAGLDSIAQGAGRCNRNGLRDMGNVYVVNPADERIERLTDIREGREVALRILDEYREDPTAFGSDLLCPTAISRYFDYYFYRRADVMDYPVSPENATRSDTLLGLLSDNALSLEAYCRINGSRPPLHLNQSFMTAAKAFQAIDAPTKGVIVPYGPEGSALISELCGAFKPELQIELLRRAQQYTVNVFPHEFDALQKAGAISEIGEETGIYHLHPTYYSEEFGLSLSPVVPLELLHD